MTGQWQSWDLKPSLLSPEFILLTNRPHRLPFELCHGVSLIVKPLQRALEVVVTYFVLR